MGPLDIQRCQSRLDKQAISLDCADPIEGRRLFCNLGNRLNGSYLWPLIQNYSLSTGQCHPDCPLRNLIERIHLRQDKLQQVAGVEREIVALQAIGVLMIIDDNKSITTISTMIQLVGEIRETVWPLLLL